MDNHQVLAPSRAQRRQLERDNSKLPAVLQQLWRSDWPRDEPGVIEVWRSRYFLVQVYEEPNGIERLSINRATLKNGDWADAITWDELQRLKRECGRGDKHAVEIYPADRDVVNVANMRHLWLMPEPLPFAWRKR